MIEVLVHGPGHDVAIGRRQGAQVGLLLGVLQQQQPGVLAVERNGAGQQFLKDDGQAVLIAVPAQRAHEEFRGGIQRRDGPHLAARLIERQALHQAEVGHLDVIAHQEKIARLDVQMLQMALHVEHVQHLGRLAQVAEQLLAWNARLARGLVFLQQLMHVLVGQLRDDDEFAVDAARAGRWTAETDGEWT